jgi:multicomponent Na+:H+ antiporter subunit C
VVVVLEAFTYILIIAILGLNALLSIYGIIYGRSLVKKLISLTILSDTVLVAVIFSGFYYTYPIVPPVYQDLEGTGREFLVKHASDPLPQALVLTGIVIGLAVNALIAFGIIQAYRLAKTTDARKVVEILSGVEVTE